MNYLINYNSHNRPQRLLSEISRNQTRNKTGRKETTDRNKGRRKKVTNGDYKLL